MPARLKLNAASYLSCLWPGLPELWYRGHVAALPTAVTFAFALNFLLIARFLYPEWLAQTIVGLACWGAIGLWLILVVQAVQQLPQLLSPRIVSQVPDRFPEAQQLYLGGHWTEAEAVLTECLNIESRDPPAMLLLAGVYRQTGRLEAAKNALQELEKLEAAAPWWLECQAEHARLARFVQAASELPRNLPDTASAQESVVPPEKGEPPKSMQAEDRVDLSSASNSLGSSSVAAAAPLASADLTGLAERNG